MIFVVKDGLPHSLAFLLERGEPRVRECPPPAGPQLHWAFLQLRERGVIYLILDGAKYLHTLQVTSCSPGGLAMTEDARPQPWGSGLAERLASRFNRSAV